VSFINPPTVTTVDSSTDAQCGDLVPEIGITSTPVIDASTGTLYVVANTKENGVFFQRLHALDITSGSEKFGGPVAIEATVPGTGDGSSGGQIAFDPLKQNQRPGLLLKNGACTSRLPRTATSDRITPGSSPTTRPTCTRLPCGTPRQTPQTLISQLQIG